MGTRRILVISPVPTHPLNAGNRARIVGLIESLKALEFSVFFLHVQQEIGSSPEMEKIWGRDFKAIDYQRRAPTFYQRCKKKMQRIFNMPSMFSYSIDEWYDSSIEKRVLRIVDECEIDTVIVEYVWYSKILEVLDKRILKIIDTHDQFANRHLHYLEKGEKPRWFSTTPKEEAKGFNRADVILAIQDSEKDKFKKLTKAKVLTVGHVVPITKYRKYEDTNGYILFVASENQINLQGINWFIAEVLPLFKGRRQGIELRIAGTICNKLGEHDSVVKLGRIDCLEEIYTCAAVVINPVTIYTGLSIKNIEALSYCRPLVVRHEDGEGDHQAYQMAESPEDFYRAIVKVLDDSEEYSRLCRAANKFIHDWNNSAMIQLSEALSSDATS